MEQGESQPEAATTEQHQQPTGARAKRHEKSSEDVKMSKALSYILRHGAEKARLPMRADGYAKVSDVIRCAKLKADEGKIVEIVKNCEKQRFAVERIDGELYIRANQGHTIKTVARDHLYKMIEDASEYPICIHGTTFKAWETIKDTGLSRMRRNEIHCAKDEFGKTLSGYRASAQVLIYVDLALCLKNGIPWFESDNGVLLTPGIGSKGVLPTGYFLKVCENATGKELAFEKRLDAEDN